MEEIKLLNETQAAEFLNISPRTLQRWRWAGNPPRFTKIGAAVRYDLAILREFVASGQRRSTSDTGPEAAP